MQSVYILALLGYYVNMQHFSVQLENTAEPVETQILNAFRDNTRLICTGVKFGARETFDLSVYEVTGRKRNLADHVLKFAGIDWTSNCTYDAAVADPTQPGAEIKLTLGSMATNQTTT